MLPVLAAFLVGAATAGAATWLARPVDGLTGESAALAGSSTQINWPGGAAGRPAPRPTPPPATTTTTDAPPPSSAKPTTTTPAPTTTTTRPAPPTTEPLPEPPPSPAAPIERVVTLVNEARVQNGCDPVTVDPRLTEAANGHSADMAKRDYFSHTSPEGVTFDKRIEIAGHPMPGAENIARGQQSADAVMDAWMKSKGHRANILNCQLKTIGVGLATDGMYWTQDFGY